jgi:hypothetical protein
VEYEAARRVALQEVLQRLEGDPAKNRHVIDVLRDLLGLESRQLPDDPVDEHRQAPGRLQ